jgi:high-affinity iron transporter
MGQMFVVTLREGIEAFLIVAIAAAYLRKTGRDALLPAVWWGCAAAVLLSLVLGGWLAEHAVQPVWEGTLALVAAVLIISMVVYMQRAARQLKAAIGSSLEQAAQKPGGGAWTGVFLFVLLMITREGMEMALITVTIARQGGLSGLFIGAALGVLAAAALAWAWLRYGHRINLALFFQATSVFLAIFALQLLIYGLHELTESNLIPLIDNQYWHDATESLAEGAIAGWITVLLVVAPIAWLAVAHLRGQKVIQAA